MSRRRARPAPRERRSFRQWLAELSATIKGIGALAVAIAAIAALVFLIEPDWRPSPTPDEGSASFSKPTVELPVTFGQYLDRVELPRDANSDEQLRRPGVLVSVEVSIKGYGDQALPLRWYVLDQGTHDIVDQQSKKHALTAGRNDAPAVWPFWVPLPRGAGPFKIVVQVYPPDARPGRADVLPLDEAETEPFPGAPA